MADNDKLNIDWNDIKVTHENLANLAQILGSSKHKLDPISSAAKQLQIPTFPVSVVADEFKIVNGVVKTNLNMASTLPGIVFEVYQHGRSEDEHVGNQFMLVLSPRSAASLLILMMEYMNEIGVSATNFEDAHELVEAVFEAAMRRGQEVAQAELGKRGRDEEDRDN